MADEFIKGLGIFTAGGLAWMVLAGWYRTPGFESTHQLVSSLAISMEQADLMNSIAVILMDVLFWFTVIATITFWVLVPAFRQARKSLREGGESS